MFVDSVKWARQEHEKWLDMSPEEQAGMERTYVLGSIKSVHILGLLGNSTQLKLALLQFKCQQVYASTQ
eukprot:2412785-Amphidinium_carterae.1